MATCPRCQLEHPDGADPCPGCGGPGAGGLLAPILTAAPLPPPMVEPILTPGSLGGGAGPASGLTRCIRRSALPVAPPPDSDRTPAPTTVHDRPAEPPPEPAALTVRSRPVADPSRTLPPPARPKLVVVRGLRTPVEFPVLEGRNTIGRFIDRPVDIDLLPQEPEYQVWCSRLHAAVVFDRGVVLVEDLNSLNGTWVNGTRLPAGQPRPLKANDLLQVGTVQLRLVFA